MRRKLAFSNIHAPEKLGNFSLLTQQQWTAIAGQPDWEQCTFEYRCGEWKVARRFVTVRQRRPKEESPQLELLETTEYDYFCYVTTEALTPWQTHNRSRILSFNR